MTLLDTPIGEIACALPGATRVFHQYKLDFCCGGDKPLREAAARRKVDTAVLLAELDALQEPASERDWRAAPAAELIDHLLKHFHEKHRVELPELIRLARRVEHVHGDRPECPNGLADLLDTMLCELDSHMMKEEQVLFPMLLRGAGRMALPPIGMMRFEHDQHGETLEKLAALTNDITPPYNACNTWRALYGGLEQLREDLMQHIHLENNVLFRQVENEAVSV